MEFWLHLATLLQSIGPHFNRIFELGPKKLVPMKVTPLWDKIKGPGLCWSLQTSEKFVFVLFGKYIPALWALG